MKAKDIKKLAEDLRENYNTRNPFELAEKYGIRMRDIMLLKAMEK